MAATPMTAAAKESFLKRILELRPIIQAEILSMGETQLALFKAELAAGEFTGIFAPLQPEYHVIKEIFDFFTWAQAFMKKVLPPQLIAKSDSTGEDVSASPDQEQAAPPPSQQNAVNWPPK